MLIGFFVFLAAYVLFAVPMISFDVRLIALPLPSL